MKNALQRGDVLGVTLPRAVNSGDGVKVGNLFGIAAMSYLQGAPGQIQVEGCFTLPKAAGTSFAAGDYVYWDDTAHLVTSTSGGNTKIGVAILAAASGSAGVAIRLNGAF